ncbi:MAG: 4Fe-4S binding protein [Thermoplasmata archaeon]|jgi:pyruvate ferredoxin oxidoreductase delta subunit/2-oxoisovalerate ferredoxin oxidoreductase delta subunit|nr:4Fe-4S binding protein [Thermoplasmata archaeon]MVT13304.1 4Fe-4S dicluster domain-containing protein [Euryarchaeota archaeon]MVT14356.1 4Fe-4S dicluster domain-containing protein [Euryarchaeota archaeon]MVT35354.1 4Fe-4S dicluster domain-containing protein [Euryarchaeota archaeon]
MNDFPTPIATVPSTGNKTGGWRTFRPVILYDKCIRCMICWKFCPEPAIKIVSAEKYTAKNAAIGKLDAPEIDYDYCKGCGICANECPVKCIEMVFEEKLEE